MKTCFIIINYNDYVSTEVLIKNIKDYKVIDHIIIVDNCSTNDSVKVLKKLVSSKIKLISSSSNQGYGSGINLGVEEAFQLCGECRIIVSNPDIIIEKEDDIETLLKDLDEDQVGMVAPTIVEGNEKNRGWKIPRPIDDILLNIIYLHRFFRKKLILYPESYYQSRFSEVGAASGCFFVTTTKVLRDIDYFDSNVFLYYEENIVGTKLIQKGYRTIIDNHVFIAHNHSISIDKSMKKIMKYKALKQSQYYFQTKYQHANAVERFFLLLTNKVSLLLFYIIYFIQDHIKVQK